MSTASGPITFITFGYLHGPAPTADLTQDLRRWLHDPAAAKDLLDLDGRDLRVQRVVVNTAGAAAAVEHLVAVAANFPPHRECLIAVGCAGGRHRSVAVALLAAAQLTLRGREVVVEHRDVHRPRVLRSAAPASTTAAAPCAFCDIVAVRGPATVVRRWPDAIAIVPLRPVVTGHLLVIPTRHVSHVAEAPAVSAAAMQAAAELAQAYEHCNVITSRGTHATQTISHLHYHVVPRNRGDLLPLPWSFQLAADQLLLDAA